MKTSISKLSSMALVLIVGLWSLAATAAPNPLQYVPEGKLLEAEKNEYKIQTPDGSVVEIEFTRKGELSEASGDLVDKDVFVPGQGLLSLSQAVEAIKEQGKNPVGEWSLEYSMLRGWYYEFEEILNGQKMEYVVSAKDGKILKSKIDN